MTRMPPDTWSESERRLDGLEDAPRTLVPDDSSGGPDGHGELKPKEQVKWQVR